MTVSKVRTACLYCSGYGVVHDDAGNEVPCTHCNGTGIVYVDDEGDMPNPVETPLEVPDVLPTDK